MSENQKIFAERHKDTLRACHAAIQGKWDEAGKLFFKGADDPTTKKRKLGVSAYHGFWFKDYVSVISNDMV
jgi:hypothetical protein